MDLRVTAAGLLVGIVAGTSGIGGGSLLAPILILFFAVRPTTAVGTDLLYSVPMKAIAAFAHLRQGTVDRNVIAQLTLGGVPGGIVGLGSFWYFLAGLGRTQFDQIVRHAIGVVIICAAVSALVIHLLRMRRSATGPTCYRPAVTIGVGAVVGCLVAITSIGSGSITLPLLLLLLPMIPLRMLIGSEIVFAALIVPIAAAGHIAFADVDWRMALNLTLGAVPGAYIGARLCAHLSEAALRPAVIGILAYAGMRLL
jgi:uncharacterized membrane protein YfcA